MKHLTGEELTIISDIFKRPPIISLQEGILISFNFTVIMKAL